MKAALKLRELDSGFGGDAALSVHDWFGLSGDARDRYINMAIAALSTLECPEISKDIQKYL